MVFIFFCDKGMVVILMMDFGKLLYCLMLNRYSDLVIIWDFIIGLLLVLNSLLLFLFFVCFLNGLKIMLRLLFLFL